jgi:hypothetical protein
MLIRSANRGLDAIQLGVPQSTLMGSKHRKARTVTAGAHLYH